VGLLLAWCLAFGLVLEFVLKLNRLDSGGDEDSFRTFYIKKYFLFSPFLWLGIGRGWVEMNLQKMLPALVTGVLLVFVMHLYGNALYSITSFFAPFVILIGQAFGGISQMDITEAVTSRNFSAVFYSLSESIMPFIILWLYHFISNLFNPAQRAAARASFGRGYYQVSGWYFAILYPILYVITLAALAGIVSNGVVLLVPDFRDRDLMFGMLSFKILPWLQLPVCMFLAWAGFSLMRNLVMSRCISLHKRFGLEYYLCFIPVLNIIPWITLSYQKINYEETAQWDYAGRMNDPQLNRSTGTVNFLIALAVISAIVSMVTGFGGMGGAIGFALLLLQLSLYISFVYRPSMIWSNIIFRLFLVMLVIFIGDQDRLYEKLFSSFYFLYSSLGLFWQKKIFHPEIEMEIAINFDELAEEKKEQPSPE
jgi:hypothetical protein